jgi:methylase of polypeptide subunit release factors
MYRVGAPWDGPPRPELVTLVERGVLTPVELAPGRAIDLGCGTGSTAIYLAQHGFGSTGVDFSSIALRTAGKRATELGMDRQVRFVQGDLTAGRSQA